MLIENPANEVNPAKEEDYKFFLFRYHFEGHDWELTVPARTYDEARERMKLMPYARYDGLIDLNAPEVAHPNFFERLRTAFSILFFQK